MSFFNLSFHLTYFLLAGSSILTGTEIISQFDNIIKPLKYVLGLETMVNIIATMAYSVLIKYSETNKFQYLSGFRYMDWFLTTPILLISFIIYSRYKCNTSIETTDKSECVDIEVNKVAIIIVVNFFMLLFGYLGEQKHINKYYGLIFGFIPFIIMFYLIKKWYITKDINTFYWIFVSIWALYGFAYMLPYKIKNIMYNILDLFAKNFFGLYLGFVLLNSMK